MTVEQRIARCLLLEKMKFEPEYCKEVGITNISTFDGEAIDIREMEPIVSTT